MKRLSPILLLFLFLVPPGLSADQPRSNREYDRESENGQFLIRMVPDDFWGHEGSGTAYRKEDGGLVDIWKVHWYAQEVYLSDTGDHLVRFGPWASDREGFSDLAVAFYKSGVLLKQYQVKDLMAGLSRVDSSLGHYRWRCEKQTKPNGFLQEDFHYHLVVCDGTAHDFDLETGEVVRKYQDPGARTWTQVQQEEAERSKERGRLLFENSPGLRPFEHYFTFDEIKAGRGSTSGIDFDEPEWGARLTPKTALSKPCRISVVFPIIDDEQVAVSIRPSSILQALEAFLAHPEIIRAFSEENATGVRMRIQGDRLHWNTKDLLNLIEMLKKHGIKTKPPDRWALFILDHSPHRYRSFYYHVDEDILITGDGYRRARDVVLYERDGTTRALE